MSKQPTVESGAMHLADLAFLEVAATDPHSSMAQRTGAAVWGYLWAVQNKRPLAGTGLEIYPSLNELREALAERADLETLSLERASHE